MDEEVLRIRLWHLLVQNKLDGTGRQNTHSIQSTVGSIMLEIFQRIRNVRTRYKPLPRNPTKGISFLVQLVFGRISVTVLVSDKLPCSRDAMCPSLKSLPLKI